MQDRNDARPAVAPANEAEILRLPDGAQVSLRAVRPQDSRRLHDYMTGLSPESRRNRLLGTAKVLPAAAFDRILRMDGAGDLMLLAFAETGSAPALVAETMQVRIRDRARVEVALSVADAWQGRGLGTLLLRRIERHARSADMRYLFGDVLRSNAVMKHLAHKAGYAIARHPTDATLVTVTKALTAPALPMSGRYSL